MTRIALAVLLLCGAASSAGAQAAATWFLAEGASNGTFDEDILVGNPSPGTLTVTVRLLPAEDAVLTGSNTRTFTLPGTGRLTVNLARDFPGLNGAASAEVSAVVQGTTTSADIVVERSMFFPRTGTPYAGGTGASGVTAPARTWTLAEGAGGVFETFILLANPGASPVNASVRYLRGDGSVITEPVTVPATGRATLWPTAAGPLDAEGFSTVVQADGPIIAERAMYFDAPAGGFARSGHDALGTTSARTTWYFAEGFTGGNAAIAFETFLLIGNDNSQPATVTATYYRDEGAPVSKVYTVLPRSRFNIWTDQERSDSGALLLPASAFSVRLESDVPVVAERAMYWGTPSVADRATPIYPWAEGHVVGGIEAPEAKWAFAEGRQGTDQSGATYDSFFLLVNPNASDIDVRAFFATEDGTGITATLTVKAHARANLWPAAGLSPAFDLLQGRRFAVFLESVGTARLPFVAERAMYWNNYAGGHANTGTPWTGTFTAPAQVPANVQIQSMSPGAGRLSGGTAVTIAGQGFGGATEVYVGGERLNPSSVTVGPASVTFTVPTRTPQTGYGVAGPTPVALLSNGRYVRAPDFTRYFSVLAFGDSLTWGVSNTYVGGLKVPLNVQRPYPLELRTRLQRNPQFGEYALVSNAGVPGEFVTVDNASVGSPGGAERYVRCANGQANCFYSQIAEPRDYFTPHDAAVILEGVNDLNIQGISASAVRNGIRSMVLESKARGTQVVLGRFESYTVDQRTGAPATIPAKVAEFNTLLDALSVEQSMLRVVFAGIDMGPDGLHPNQIGYDEMAAIAYDKLRLAFPRCPPGQASCP